MPYGRINQTLYTAAGATVEQLNSATLYKPGELGSQIQVGNKSYQLVQLDSGATSATNAGTPVAGHLAFWKNKSTYLVTNDKAQALGQSSSIGRNFVAGVFVPLTVGGAAGSTTATAGNFCVIQQRGTHVGVFTAGNTVTIGQSIVADNAATADGIAVAVGTAPTDPVVGIATASNGAVTSQYTPATLGGWDLVDVP